MPEDTNRLCSEILTKITTQGVTLDTINTQVGKLQDEIVDIKVGDEIEVFVEKIGIPPEAEDGIL